MERPEKAATMAMAQKCMYTSDVLHIASTIQYCSVLHVH